MLLVVLAYACADTRWRKEGASEEQWRRDTAACRIEAAERVRRETERDALSRNDSGYSPGYYGRSSLGREGTLDLRMTVFEATRRRNTLTHDCLKRRGYRQVKDDEE
jgi:hypothetical protein